MNGGADASATARTAGGALRSDPEFSRLGGFGNSWAAFVLPPVLVIGVIVVLPTIQLIDNSLYRWSLLSGLKRFDGLGQ
jgi:ABC-type sugar transport system permease subunit